MAEAEPKAAHPKDEKSRRRHQTIRPIISLGFGNWFTRMLSHVSLRYSRSNCRRSFSGLSGGRVAHSSFPRFFNSANARPARRPSLVAVESSSLAWSARPASNAVNQRRKRASWSGGSLTIASASSSTFMCRNIAPLSAVAGGKGEGESRLTIGLASTSRPLVDAWGVLAGHQNAIPERER